MFKNLKSIFGSKPNPENNQLTTTEVMNTETQEVEQIPEVESISVDTATEVDNAIQDKVSNEDETNLTPGIPVTDLPEESLYPNADNSTTPSIPTYEELTSFNPAEFVSSEELLNSPEIVGWLSTQEQELLFSALLLFYSPEQTLLDVGCGRADLFGYCNNLLGTTIPYKGIDYNPNILNVASQKYPGVNVETVDILNSNDDTYDWVVGSGLFNLLDYEDMETYSKTVIQKMYNKSNVGIAFNLLTGVPEDMADEDVAQLVIHDQTEWFKYLTETYGKVVCRTDYLSGDITFIILK
jgi:hypothetical protein